MCLGTNEVSTTNSKSDALSRPCATTTPQPVFLLFGFYVFWWHEAREAGKNHIQGAPQDKLRGSTPWEKNVAAGNYGTLKTLLKRRKYSYFMTYLL